MECTYITEDNMVKWAWEDPENNSTLRFDLPQCWPICNKKPPVIEDTHKNWTREVFLSELGMKIDKKVK